MQLKDATFEAVTVGEAFGPVEVVIDDHLIKSFAFAADDYTPWYFDSGVSGWGRLGHSAMLAKELVAIFLTAYDANSVVGLHQKEEVWYHAPVRFGTRVTLSGRYVDKYTKRGKGYVVLDGEARDELGNLLVRQRSTEIMRVPEKVALGAGSAPPPDRRVTGTWPGDKSPESSVRPDVPVGTPIAPLTKRVYQDQMAVFSGIGKHWHNIHTDIEAARRGGFSQTLAQGMMETCWLSEMLGNYFGPSWLSNGWMAMAFLNPVFANDLITGKGVVIDARDEPDGRQLELEIWCENEQGQMTAAGWAKGVAARA
ncbi:MAG: MaoC/PaaZ C-terminal domain-containing protein [Thermomicrobiales bacterium]